MYARAPSLIVVPSPLLYKNLSNQLTCDTAYWSGATVSDFEGASKELMKAFGLSDNPAQYCPGQNPK